MTSAEDANRRDRERDEARLARFTEEHRLAKKQRQEKERAAKPRIVTIGDKIQEPPEKAQERPMHVTTPLPAEHRRSVDDRDSAAGVLALARRLGLPGLRKPKSDAKADAEASSPKAEAPDDDAKTEAILALARRASIPGLRKR